MKKFKITKREILYFILGLFAMLVIQIAYDWESFTEGFMDGYNEVRKESVIQQE